MRSKLTSEDKDWLEHRLSAAMVPVVPRAAFVHDAKLALMSAAPDGEGADGRARWLPLVSVTFIAVGVALLFAAVARRRGWL